MPTTLLARQHYYNFKQRMAGFPLNVRMLSRLQTPAEARKVKEGLKDGAVDIVIGTHALLANNIEFANLGLLIIDEEQHFGVAHKEKLKNLKADVHVLTLTATPIPRTLQMSLTGVKQLSIIATPPVDRLAARTFVMPFDGVMIKEAIYREKFRGGQTFVVCPRVSDIARVFDVLQELAPDAKILVAHGQMPVKQLEEVMNDFADRKGDILLSTTIIESGIDHAVGQHYDRLPGGHVWSGSALPAAGTDRTLKSTRVLLFYGAGTKESETDRRTAAEHSAGA